MRSLELGRQISKYVTNTAIEASGIGAAWRAYREKVSEAEQFILAIGPLYEGVNDGLAHGICRIAAPFLQKSLEEDYKANDMVKGGIDMFAEVAIMWWAFSGNLQGAIIAKISYNTLVQIAPDVAKLAKNRVFQRAK